MLLIALFIGNVPISPLEILHILMTEVFGFDSTTDLITRNLIINIRLPRVIISFVTGAALAVSGSVVQSVLKNPLSSSYTLGVSSGSSLAVVLVLVLGLSSSIFGMFFTPLLAAFTGIVTIFIVLTLAKKINRGLSDITVVLVGMVISIFINSLAVTIGNRFPAYAAQINRWQMGVFSLHTWPIVIFLTISTIIFISWISFYHLELDILTFGDDQATSMGIDTVKVKRKLLIISSTLTGIIVSFVGVIGFVDLIAPHVIRRFFNASHKTLIPLAAIFGGIFMTLADIIARTIIAPSELSIGSVTALFGVPFFFLILLKKGDFYA